MTYKPADEEFFKSRAFAREVEACSVQICSGWPFHHLVAVLGAVDRQAKEEASGI